MSTQEILTTTSAQKILYSEFSEVFKFQNCDRCL